MADSAACARDLTSGGSGADSTTCVRRAAPVAAADVTDWARSRSGAGADPTRWLTSSRAPVRLLSRASSTPTTTPTISFNIVQLLPHSSWRRPAHDLRVVSAPRRGPLGSSLRRIGPCCRELAAQQHGRHGQASETDELAWNGAAAPTSCTDRLRLGLLVYPGPRWPPAERPRSFLCSVCSLLATCPGGASRLRLDRAA